MPIELAACNTVLPLSTSTALPSIFTLIFGTITIILFSLIFNYDTDCRRYTQIIFQFLYPVNPCSSVSIKNSTYHNSCITYDLIIITGNITTGFVSYQFCLFSPAFFRAYQHSNRWVNAAHRNVHIMNPAIQTVLVKGQDFIDGNPVFPVSRGL